ncbi:UDP-N-acetylglucosamine 2-epimerase [Burkholderiales bacterium GJ-E10]|nr:UDP-N-acetylglucosamine 2-epimerase [Burkholderiales bacterium GJ-E10]
MYDRGDNYLDARRGDVNSTIACGLVAVKKDVPVIHVEAGLRSFDRGMPEEINRVLTDQISDLLYTTERSAHANLAREGIAAERVAFVGNLMIDSLLAALPKAVATERILQEAGAPAVEPGRYGVVTLHRPSNVDRAEDLGAIVAILNRVAAVAPLVWPIHPRTQAKLEQFGLSDRLAPGIVRLPPQGYLEMVGLMKDAAFVLTDSGGIQEETTALGVPCLTLRDNTERPITVEQGTNTLVARDAAVVLAAVQDIVAHGGKRGRAPEYWDGQAAPRIARHLRGWLQGRGVV